jgi:hypothetical protein
MNRDWINNNALGRYALVLRQFKLVSNNSRQQRYNQLYYDSHEFLPGDVIFISHISNKYADQVVVRLRKKYYIMPHIYLTQSGGYIGRYLDILPGTGPMAKVLYEK